MKNYYIVNDDSNYLYLEDAKYSKSNGLKYSWSSCKEK